MKSRKVDTVTTNEELVRLRIFDGVIPADYGMEELLDLEKKQRAVERAEFLELRDKHHILHNKVLNSFKFKLPFLNYYVILWKQSDESESK